MSLTLYAIITAAVPIALKSIGNFAKGNRDTFNALLKQSKPAIFDISKKVNNTLNDELCKYEKDGWEKDNEG